MNLNEITPIIEQIVKDTLRERNYPFGGRPGSVRTGLSNKVASSTLVNSVKVVKQQTEGVDFITIDLAPYGLFVDSGRKPGSFVPVSAIMTWLQEKGIGVRNEKGQFVKGHREAKKLLESANNQNTALPVAFAIQKNIQKFGIRSTNFTDIVYHKLQENKQIMKLVEKESIDDLLSLLNFQSLNKEK